MLIDNIWVISDIHGSYNTLLALLDKIPVGAKICFTGDLIDRGPDSLSVIQLIIDKNFDCVLGNHEYFMLHPKNHLFRNKSLTKNWIDNGGAKTRDSYLNEPDLYIEHLKFLEKLPVFKYYEFKNGATPLVVSHSVILDLWKGPSSIFNDLENFDIMSRHLTSFKIIPFLKIDPDSFEDKDVFNIMGHTILDDIVIGDNFAAIDTGGFKIDGRLTALNYPSFEKIEQENLEVFV